MSSATTSQVRSESSVLQQIGTLLDAHEARDAILAIVQRLVDENARLLAERARRANVSEHISRAQLSFFAAAAKEVDEARSSDDALEQATSKLDAASKAVLDAADALRKARLEAKRAAKEAKRGPRKAHEHLEAVTNRIPVPPEQRQCPNCGSECAHITTESTTTFDYVPAKIIRRIDVREVVACRACERHVGRPAKPDNKVIDGGRYGAALNAAIVVEKFEDGVPLHRKRQQWLRLGFDMPYSSMVTQVETVADTLEPVWRALKLAVLMSRVMHLDGTSLPVLAKKRVAHGVLWGIAGVNGDERVAAYTYCSTGEARGRPDRRSGELREEGPLDLLDRRVGPVVLDASNLFDPAFLRHDIIEVGCNMHARRYYVKALEANDVRAVHAISAFAALYAIEDELAGKSPHEKLRHRTEKSRPIYEALVEWASTVEAREPPKSNLGRAVAYHRRHRVALMRFLDNGELPIDNGLTERLHRRPAVMRNAALFAGSHEGGRRAAIISSVMAACRLAGADPFAYLADILPRLARGVAERDIPALLPLAWRRVHGAQSLVTVAEMTRFR